jgi:hypothetical protein
MVTEKPGVAGEGLTADPALSGMMPVTAGAMVEVVVGMSGGVVLRMDGTEMRDLTGC